MSFFFFFNDTATTEIYTLSLHDALPIWATAWGERGALQAMRSRAARLVWGVWVDEEAVPVADELDRKSTRLNSSHSQISYAVFCLKKKKKNTSATPTHTYP